MIKHNRQVLILLLVVENLKRSCLGDRSNVDRFSDDRNRIAVAQLIHAWQGVVHGDAIS